MNNSFEKEFNSADYYKGELDAIFAEDILATILTDPENTEFVVEVDNPLVEVKHQWRQISFITREQYRQILDKSF